MGTSQSRGLPMGQTEWAAVCAFRERCRGWLRGGAPGDTGSVWAPLWLWGGEAGSADSSLEISEEATGRDVGSLGWRSGDDGQRGQCEDAEMADLGDRCGGTKTTGEDSQSHKGLLRLPKGLPHLLLQALPCLGPLLRFPHQPASLGPVVLSKAVLDGVPGHADTWPWTSVPQLHPFSSWPHSPSR